MTSAVRSERFADLTVALSSQGLEAHGRPESAGRRTNRMEPRNASLRDRLAGSSTRPADAMASVPEAASRLRGEWPPPAGDPTSAGPAALATLVRDAKFAPHTAVAPAIPRLRLFDKLDAFGSARILAVVAPAGYGKTTLLEQWVSARKRSAAWLTADGDDNDPRVLIRSIDASLAHSSIARSEPFVLVVDAAERITNPRAIEAALAFASSIPEGSQVALATRTMGAWPLARLRAERKAGILSTRDLALADDEAAQVLAAAGLRVPAATARALNHAADGWAAGLYLFASDVDDSREAGASDRPVPAASPMLVAYVREEVLGALTDDERAFLLRTSILDHLSPSLCDVVLDTPGAAETLARLDERDGLFVQSPDDLDTYRLPGLIRAVLKSEFERSDSEGLRELQSRAAAWYEAQGRLVDAAAQASAAADGESLTRLLPEAVRRAIALGRTSEARSWVEQLELSGQVGRKFELQPAVALTYATSGESAAAERWSEAAWTLAKIRGRRKPLGEASVTRALVCRWGWPRMRSDARLALRLLPPGHDDMLVAHFLLGVADTLAGDPERAEAGFRRASIEVGSTAKSAWGTAMALAYRAMRAHANRDRTGAEVMLRASRAVVLRAHLDREPAGVLVSALGARIAATRGLMAQARSDLAAARENIGVASSAMPWLAARVRIDIAATQIALSDFEAASETLNELRDLLRSRPNLGTLENEVDHLDEQLRLSRRSRLQHLVLTAAELRLLPFLATHLSMSEIAARLFLSTNTVKTEAKSVYRKLAVSCRSDAVERATGVGLLQARGDLLGLPPANGLSPVQSNDQREPWTMRLTHPMAIPEPRSTAASGPTELTSRMPAPRVERARELEDSSRRLATTNPARR